MAEQVNNFVTALLQQGKEVHNSTVTVEALKDIIKSALGDRYTDQQLDFALESLGVPRNGSINVNEFCTQLALPTTHALKEMKEDALGSWLTVEEWMKVLNRLGMHVTLEQTAEMVQLAKRQTIDDVARERLALEKIGIDLTKDDLERIIADAQKTANSIDTSDDSSDEYETEEERTLTEDYTLVNSEEDTLTEGEDA